MPYEDGDMRRAFEAGWTAAEFMGNVMSASEAYDLFLTTKDHLDMKQSSHRKTALATCGKCGKLFQQRRRGAQRERFCSKVCVYKSWRDKRRKAVA